MYPSRRAPLNSQNAAYQMESYTQPLVQPAMFVMMPTNSLPLPADYYPGRVQEQGPLLHSHPDMMMPDSRHPHRSYRREYTVNGDRPHKTSRCSCWRCAIATIVLLTILGVAAAISAIVFIALIDKNVVGPTIFSNRNEIPSDVGSDPFSFDISLAANSSFLPQDAVVTLPSDTVVTNMTEIKKFEVVSDGGMNNSSIRQRMISVNVAFSNETAFGIIPSLRRGSSTTLPPSTHIPIPTTTPMPTTRLISFVTLSHSRVNLPDTKTNMTKLKVLDVVPDVVVINSSTLQPDIANVRLSNVTAFDIILSPERRNSTPSTNLPPTSSPMPTTKLISFVTLSPGMIAAPSTTTATAQQTRNSVQQVVNITESKEDLVLNISIINSSTKQPDVLLSNKTSLPAFDIVLPSGDELNVTQLPSTNLSTTSTASPMPTTQLISFVTFPVPHNHVALPHNTTVLVVNMTGVREFDIVPDVIMINSTTEQPVVNINVHSNETAFDIVLQEGENSTTMLPPTILPTTSITFSPMPTVAELISFVTAPRSHITRPPNSTTTIAPSTTKLVSSIDTTPGFLSSVTPNSTATSLLPMLDLSISLLLHPNSTTELAKTTVELKNGVAVISSTSAAMDVNVSTPAMTNSTSLPAESTTTPQSTSTPLPNSTTTISSIQVELLDINATLSKDPNFFFGPRVFHRQPT